MKIELQQSLDFNNVLIRPQRTTISSRSEVSLERDFYFKKAGIKWRGVPIMAANMDTTGTFEVSNVLNRFNMLTCLHKFYSVNDVVKKLSHIGFREIETRSKLLGASTIYVAKK